MEAFDNDLNDGTFILVLPKHNCHFSNVSNIGSKGLPRPLRPEIL
jgi:hypothetical protein